MKRSSRNRERADKAFKERDNIMLDRDLWDSERERLEKEVADLKVAMVLTEDEPKSVTNLRTRADFVAKIQILESDCVDALADSFEASLNQLLVLNPRLNIERIGVLSQVVDGRVVPPPDSPEDEAGTPRSD